MANLLIQKGFETALAVTPEDYDRYFRGQGYARMGTAPSDYPLTRAPAGSSSGSAGQTASAPTGTQSANVAVPSGYVRLSDDQAGAALGSQSDFEDVHYVGTYPNGSYVAYQIPTATVIGPSGERVKVRTDNRTGTYRTEQEMLSQGFQRERSPGVASDGSTPGGAAVNLANRPNLRTIDGQTISPLDPNYDAYLRAGARPVAPAPSQTAPQGAANVPPAPGASDASGVDMAGWTEPMKTAYQAMADYVQKLQNQGKVVNPNIKIDDATIQRFMEQAKTEVAPFYRQVFDQANQDLKTAFGQISADYAAKVRDIGSSYGQALEQAQQSFAQRGREFSSDRDKAEARLATEASNQISDAERAARESAQAAGTKVERAVGSANLAQERGSLFGGQAPVVGQPGVYGLTAGTGTRDLFAPAGNTFGEQERNQLFDVQQRKTDLMNAEQQLRAGYTM